MSHPRIKFAGNSLHFQYGTTGTFTTRSKLLVESNNNLKFVGNTNTDKVTLNGIQDANISNVYAEIVYTSSDKRLKENIKPLEKGLDLVSKMNPVTFDWKNKKKNKKSLGFIAQEMNKILPEVVYEPESSDDNFLKINYSVLTSVLVKSIQELREEVNSLKKELSEIKKI